jgi:hypothetical protein
MSRRLLTISAAVALLVTIASAQTAPPTSQMVGCSSTSDCKSATCCGVSVCVNQQFAPTQHACTSVSCPKETPGPVMGCECADNACRTVSQPVITIETFAPGGASATPVPTSTVPADSLMTCSADGDCGMQTCCEANLCIATRYAPDCFNITSRVCPQMQLNCKCTNNRCARGATAAPPTTSGPATTGTSDAPAADDGNADTNSLASSVPVVATIVAAAVACLVVYNL